MIISRSTCSYKKINLLKKTGCVYKTIKLNLCLPFRDRYDIVLRDLFLHANQSDGIGIFLCCHTSNELIIMLFFYN